MKRLPGDSEHGPLYLPIIVPQFAFVAILLASAASSRAQLPSNQLCEAYNGSSGCIDFGYRSSGSGYQRPERPERSCPECEARERAELEHNLETMEHPSPVPPLDSDATFLDEDVAAANSEMDALDLALAGVLAAPALEAALDAAATLFLLNAVVAVSATAFPDRVRVPPWLNLLSLARAASLTAAATCDALLAAARSACGTMPEEKCDPNDDCRALLDKRKARLACERAWYDLRRAKDSSDRSCQTPKNEREAWTDNAREVSDCGFEISRRPECCPSGIAARKSDYCKKGKRSCTKENDLDDSFLAGLDAKGLAGYCETARARVANAEACQGAREAERDQCYEGFLDAGHAEELDTAASLATGCRGFLENVRRFVTCP